MIKSGSTDERTMPVRFDRVAIGAAAGLLVCLGLLAAAVSPDAWLSRLFAHRWLTALTMGLIAVVALTLVDLMRPKNLMWRALRRRYGPCPADARAGGDHAAGSGRLGTHSFRGLGCFASPTGLAAVRILSVLHRPLFIPWSAIAAIEAYPSLMTGRPGFETDMQASVRLRDQSSPAVELPWLAEFRERVPKTVGFHSAKRPERVRAAKRGREPSDARFRQAQQLHDSGQRDKAERICRQILATDPRSVDALQLLGRIAVERGQSSVAIRHFSAAVAIAPAQADLRQGLGNAYRAAGQVSDAIRCFREAITIDPKEPTAHADLGNCYWGQRNLAEAAACYRAAIAADPKDAIAYVYLADLLRDLGDADGAVDNCRKALRLRADLPEAHFGLARALLQRDDLEEGVAILRKIADSQRDNALFYYELGRALSRLGKPDEAIATLREGIDRKPDFAMNYNSLGGELHERGDLEGAIACYRKALAVKVEFPRVHAWIHSNLLLAMNYEAASTQKKLFEKSLQFDERQTRRLLRKARAFDNTREPGRVLKLGYVSPDFREHSVAHFIRKLIGAHDRKNVEVYCYSEVLKPDELTRGFEAQADHWLSIVGVEDRDLAERIRKDRIDILVDLTGHTADNRLLTFGRRPAPVQVTWLGYPNTTGMRAMDYRLTDAIADPPGEPDRLHTEELVRLEHGFLCYQSNEARPAVAEAPLLKKGHVTFGSFNTTKKVTPEVVRLWAQVLMAVPTARLLLKSYSLRDETTKAGMLEAFRRCGVAEERLDLVAFLPGRDGHLKLYSEIDIGLDPFPYNGTTTTCEALWMGVPVIVLRGDRHAGRVGISIMHHLGLPELIADSREAYVALAAALAGDQERLTGLRDSLRPRMSGSPLTDVRLFTETLENAYRQMWIKWCASGQ
jgi:predicted O-linked N-acetylglucosamine transferase (SPINDLY family)